MWTSLLLACAGTATDGAPATSGTGDTGPAGHSAATTTPGTPTGTPGTPTGETAAPPPPPDYRSPGPHAAVSATLTSRATSCRGGSFVERFDPDGVPSSVVVVLAHGFSGDHRQMTGWGEHWASWGVSVLVPDLCHSLPWNVDHEQNGADLVAIAADLAPGSTPFYVGYSAGGLAALVASASDPGSGGDLGLDAVDAFSIAGGYASSLQPTSADLHGEPSTCNTQENMVLVYDGLGLATLRVAGADHCDWMWPPDATCRLVCATGPDDASIADTIHTLATAWVLWRTGQDPAAATWWTPGEPGYEALLADGRIAP